MQNNQASSKTSTRKQFYFLTLSHTVLDSYATLLSHLQPLLLAKLATAGARNSLAGYFISVYSIFSSLGQIFFGWLSDKFRTVHFLTVGVGFTAIGLSLLWVAPSPNIVCLLLAIGGIGVASFHPQATAYAGALAAEGRGMGTSIFLTGGNIGRALGPLVLLFIPYHFERLEYLAWEMIPGVLVALLVPKVLKFEQQPDLTASTRGTPSEAPRQQAPFWTVASPRMLPLIVLFIIAAIRTVTLTGLENFLSVHLDDQNYADQVRSLVIALFIFAGSMGIMSSGWLMSRVNTYVLLLISLLGAPPLLYASLHADGFSFLALLFIGNVVLSSSITINIILAQLILRGYESIASSLMMGAAWGVGGLLNLWVGTLADQFGLPIVLDGLVMLPLVLAPLLILLRDQPDLSKPSV